MAKPPEWFRDHRPSPGERLDGAILSGITMQDQDWLRGTVLIGADFEKANLEGANLQRADLRGARFDEAHAKNATFDDANLEDASFESTKLQRASFENASLNNTEISESRVSRRTGFDDVVNYEREFKSSDDRDEQEGYFDGATWVYRQLQELSRRNALFREAGFYFVREKDLRRRYAWRRGDYLHALQAETSRWLIGYGRNPWRVVAISGVVIALCALLFPLVGGLQDTAMAEPITYSIEVPTDRSIDQLITIWGKSLYFSVVTFGTLGYGDIRPIGTTARALAGIETLVGFGLIALLISVLLSRGSWL